ncbi:Na+/H+ antiporter subunit G [Litoreibacter sp.]|nr:Na+/H+ antiporter subunit G [Litoreibacter sp.]
MTYQIIATYAVAFLLLIGTIFTLVGAIGLLKLPDAMTRLHAPTKVGTVGVGAFLLASMINSYTTADGSVHELLIMAFLFVTAPISANFIAKVVIHGRHCEETPLPPRDDTWSTLNVPEQDREIVETG